MGLSGAALVMPEGPAFLLGEMTRLVGQGAVHLVAGEFAGCAQSGAVELSCPLGLWCAKLVGNALWRAVLSGQQKGRLIRAAHRESFLPCRRSVSSGTAEGLGFRRRQPPSSFAGCWSTFLPFCYLRASDGPFGRRR